MISGRQPLRGRKGVMTAMGSAFALALGLEVSIAISVLLAAVASGYRQVCIAYPTGLNTSSSTGSTGCCITGPPNNSRRPSSAANTPPSPTSRTAAIADRAPRRLAPHEQGAG